MAQMSAVSDFLLALEVPMEHKRPEPDFEAGPFSIKDCQLVDLTAADLVGGEALTGLKSGNEIAHIEGFAGGTGYVAGYGYAAALGRQQDFLNNLEAVFFPNSSVKPRTLLVTKVKTDSIFRAAQMFGPVQQAVADAVMTANNAGYFGDADLDNDDNIRICVAPFIHPSAGLDKDGKQLTGDALAHANYALYWNNFWATLALLHEMVTGGAKNQEVLERWENRGDHPFLGFTFAAK